ncbi:hypothetical protein AOLI_G00254480 [Acnodon oligacanthus]
MFTQQRPNGEPRQHTEARRKLHSGRSASSRRGKRLKADLDFSEDRRKRSLDACSPLHHTRSQDWTIRNRLLKRDGSSYFSILLFREIIG